MGTGRTVRSYPPRSNAAADHLTSCSFISVLFLFELDRSTTYEHRLELLGRKGLPPRTRTALAAHLGGSSLIYWIRYHIPNRAALGNREFWTPTQLTKLVGRKGADHDGVDGLDSGPSRMWLETNKDFAIDDTPYCPENSYLRRCGYVMWDVPASETDALGVDDEVRRWIEEGRRRGLIERLERNKGQEEMKQSWERGQPFIIRVKGGTGSQAVEGLFEIEHPFPAH